MLGVCLWLQEYTTGYVLDMNTEQHALCLWFQLDHRIYHRHKHRTLCDMSLVPIDNRICPTHRFKTTLMQHVFGFQHTTGYVLEINTGRHA